MRKCTLLADVGRRQFLRGGAVAAAGTAALGGGALAASPTVSPGLARVSLPSMRLANERDLVVDEPVHIAYPDEDSPGVLIKLGQRAAGGVGRDGDIVAFSILCPHKGYPLSYAASDRTLNCPGHYSRFDCEKAGQQVFGHATQNLPQFTLRVDDRGDIFAEGVDELIYGRLSNGLAG